MSRIAIITDTTPMQTNGVVRSLREVISQLKAQGHDIETVMIDPKRFSFPSGYPDIRLQFLQGKRITRQLDRFQPDLIHIATEGPIGISGRAYCLRRQHAFTTALHTKYYDYMPPRIEARLGEKAGKIAGSLTARYMKWFHGPSSAIMVATETVRQELVTMGYRNLVRWSRGVDLSQFRPSETDNDQGSDLKPAVFITHCRIAPEKNLRAFLTQVQGSKIVIGDGPQLSELRRDFPDVEFPGMLNGEELTKKLREADVYVMPSKSETFGLVLLEALACGLPVAAYNTPINHEILDILGPHVASPSDDIADAARNALELRRSGAFNPEAARAQIALLYSWKRSAQQFYSNLCANTKTRQRRLRYLTRLQRPFQPLPILWQHIRNRHFDVPR